MNTITSFTKEQLIKRLEEQESSARYALGFVRDSEILRDIEMDLRINEIALASLTAEPVAWTDADELRDAKNVGNGYLFAIGGNANKFADPRRQMMLYAAPPAPVVRQEPIAWLNDAYLARGVVDGEAGSEDAGPGYIPVYREPLYAVQPAPVVPEELLSAMEEVLRISDRDHEAWHKARNGIVSCRAAMLQGAEPVTTAYKLPELRYLDTVKFNADCALQDPESIYAQEFFLSLDEVFGERGNYTEPVQAKAVSILIAEIFRLRGYPAAPAFRHSWRANP